MESARYGRLSFLYSAGSGDDSYRDNGDGTLTLKVEAVWEDENTDCAFTHEVTVRPERDEKFQYVSNHILPNSGIKNTSIYKKERRIR